MTLALFLAVAMGVGWALTAILAAEYYRGGR